jgi:hypothetical protein
MLFMAGKELLSPVQVTLSKMTVMAYIAKPGYQYACMTTIDHKKI